MCDESAVRGITSCKKVIIRKIIILSSAIIPVLGKIHKQILNWYCLFQLMELFYCHFRISRILLSIYRMVSVGCKNELKSKPFFIRLCHNPCKLFKSFSLCIKRLCRTFSFLGVIHHGFFLCKSGFWIQ